MPPAPLPQDLRPDAIAELHSWLRRLQETASDLARRVADQEDRLDRLTLLLEAAGDRPPALAAHRLAAFPAPGPSSPWRRLAGRLLRAPGAVMRRLRGAAASRWILPVADEKSAPPLLRLGEEVVAIELAGRAADLPEGLLDLALRVLASEGLFFLELRGRTAAGGENLELWLCRREWPWRLAADLRRPLPALPAGGPLLGRRVVLDGDPHGGGTTPALAGYEMRCDYWLRPGAPAGLEHRVLLGPAAAPAAPTAPAAPGRTAIVLTRPLDGGLEVLVAAALRALREKGREVVLAATHDLRGSHRSLAEVAPREIRVYPLATFSPPELRAALLARLLEHEAADTLFHIGPGGGFFDQAPLQELLRRCRVIDLPLPLLPGSPISLGRPPGGVDRTLDLLDGAFPLPAGPAPAAGPGARAGARERLGVPAGVFLACQVADLVPGERPEDLVELAVRCPQVFFLQVGRGGLAGRRDDLLRFRGVVNLRCLPAADLGEVLAAADVMLALGDPSLWPWPIFAALAAGVPVAGRPAGVLARRAGAMNAAGSLAEIAGAIEALRAGRATAPASRPDAPEAGAEGFEAALARLLA